MSLITAAQAREKIPSLTGTGEDTLLGTLITGVGRAFARYCGYPPASAGGNPTMESATYTRYQDGPGGRVLYLEVWPVTSITSIEDDPTLDFAGSTYVVAAADYGSGARDGARGMVVLKTTAAHSAWNTVEGCIKAVYVAGFSTVPDDLQELAKHAVRHAYDLRSTQGRTNVGQGGVNVGFREEDFLPALVREGLAPYRLPRSLGLG